MNQSDKVLLKNLIYSCNSNLTKLPKIEEIICISCDDIAQGPVRCKSCQILYCNDCADRTKNKRKKCLFCKNSQSTLSYTPDDKIDKLINYDLIFICRNGCNYKTSKISEISYHLIDCNLVLKTCPNENCDFKGTELELESHSKNCKFFSIKCSECNYKLSSLIDVNNHNCMIKIVEDLTKIEEMIEKEREVLENYIRTKKENLIEIARINNINIEDKLSDL